ncbi:MAG TPA: AAA-like domain-containing protein [Pyrinomonadaceae bacterium]|jgi:WD40 repeat protein
MPETIYTVGGTVQAGSGFYIPRRADDELLALCRTGSFAYILSPRQIGKSSLMVHTAERLAEDKIQSVIIDLTQIGVQVTAEEWYLGLLAMIEDQLSLSTDVVRWWQANSQLGITQRLTLFFRDLLLQETDAPVVIFVDEIDTTLGLSFTDDFFAAIRYFYNARSHVPQFQRLSFVLIGVATPGDLIRDPQRTPFNIGQRVELTDWTFEEALPLAAGLGLAEDEARAALRQVLKWTGGHPYLTQRLCRVMIDERRDHWTERDVELLVASTFFGERSEQDNNLQFIRDMLTKRAPDLTGVLETYRDIRNDRRTVRDEEQSLVKTHLKLSGVVHREQNSLRVRNPIYAQVFDNRWVKEHLPVNWPKRLQRAAVGLTVAVLLLLIPLTIYAINRAVVAERQTKLAQQQTLVAKQQTKEADDARVFALEAARLTEVAYNRAKEQGKNAELLKQIAEDQRAEAEKQRRIADEERKKADSLRQVAEKQKQVAQGQSQTATEQKRVAVEQSQKAKAQSQIGYARQLEISANDAVNRNEVLEAESYLAKALLLDDRIETRRRLADAQIKGARVLWTSAQGSSPKDSSVAPSRDESTFTITVGANTTADAPPIAFSPEGRLLAVVGADTIKLRNADTGEELRSLPVPKAAADIREIFFSADGRRLFGGNYNGSIKSWSVETGKQLQPSTGAQDNTTMSSGGRPLAATIDGKVIRLRDAETGKELRTLAGNQQRIANIVFSPDRRLLASVDAVLSMENSITVWNVETGVVLRISPNRTNRVDYLAFSPDNRFIAMGDSDRIVVLDVEGKGDAPRLSLTDRLITGLAFGSDGFLAYTRQDNTVRLWNVQTGKESLILRDQDTEHTSSRSITRKTIAFSANGRLAVMGIDQSLRVWDIPRPLSLDFEGISRAVALSPAGQSIAIGRADNTIILQDMMTGRQLRLLSGHKGRITGIAFSRDGKRLVSSDFDRTILLWDVEKGKEILRFQGHASIIYGIALSPDGKLIASAGGNDYAALWDAETGRQRRVFPLTIKDDSIASVAFSPDGKLLAIGSNKKILVWDVEKDKEKFSISSNDPSSPSSDNWLAASLTFSPDGKLLVSGGSGKIQFWDVANGKEIRKLSDFGAVTSVVFSPDGRWLASAGKTVRLRSLDKLSDENYLELHIHNNAPFVVAFSTDGKWLVSGGEDKTVQLWSAEMLERTLTATPSEVIAEVEQATGLQVLGINLNPILSQDDLKSLLDKEYDATLSATPIPQK